MEVFIDEREYLMVSWEWEMVVTFILNCITNLNNG